MGSYNIWNSVNSCLYKGKQSYGVKDHSEIDILGMVVEIVH